MLVATEAYGASPYFDDGGKFEKVDVQLCFVSHRKTRAFTMFGGKYFCKTISELKKNPHMYSYRFHLFKLNIAYVLYIICN